MHVGRSEIGTIRLELAGSARFAEHAHATSATDGASFRGQAKVAHQYVGRCDDNPSTFVVSITPVHGSTRAAQLSTGSTSNAICLKYISRLAAVSRSAAQNRTAKLTHVALLDTGRAAAVCLVCLGTRTKR